MAAMTSVTSDDPISRPRGTSYDPVTRLASPGRVSQRPRPQEGSVTSLVSFLYMGIYSVGVVMYFRILSGYGCDPGWLPEGSIFVKVEGSVSSRVSKGDSVLDCMYEASVFSLVWVHPVVF